MFEFKSQSDIEKMSDEEKTKYFRDAQDALAEIAEKNGKDLGLAKEQIEEMKSQLRGFDISQMKSMVEAQKTQGAAIEELLKGVFPTELTVSEKSQINKFINDNKEQIQKLHANKSGSIEFTTKAIIENANATLPVPAPALVGVQSAAPMNVNLRGIFIDNFINTFQTSLAAYPYTETLPKTGDFACVLEKGIKPEIDFLTETRYVTPCKLAAHECLTDEVITDIPGMQDIATNYLRRKHDLRKQKEILFGTGVAGSPSGAYTLARAFIAGAMANCVVNANFMDVVNAMKTDIYTTHNFIDELPYTANIVLVNPVDFYCELVAAKDLNGLPLYPMASLFNNVTIGGCTIIPWEDVPAGEVLVADLTKMNISNYVPYTVRFGWINDDFIKNQFCIVGESRFHAYVKELDKNAFVKGNIAAIKRAISV